MKKLTNFKDLTEDELMTINGGFSQQFIGYTLDWNTLQPKGVIKQSEYNPSAALGQGNFGTSGNIYKKQGGYAQTFVNRATGDRTEVRW